MPQKFGKGLVAAMEAVAEQQKIDDKHIEKGAFHKWLGKAPGEKITEADIEKGLASDDPKIRKMAQFAKNAKKWKHGKKGTVATEAAPVVPGAVVDPDEDDPNKPKVEETPIEGQAAPAAAPVPGSDDVPAAPPPVTATVPAPAEPAMAEPVTVDGGQEGEPKPEGMEEGEDDGLSEADMDAFTADGGTDEDTDGLSPITQEVGSEPPPDVPGAEAAGAEGVPPVAAPGDTPAADVGHTVTFTTQQVTDAGKAAIDEKVQALMSAPASPEVDPNETVPAPDFVPMTAQDETNEADNFATECLNASTALEAIFTSLKKAVPIGGMNRVGAELLTISATDAYAKAGIRGRTITPALESFDNVGPRIVSTKTAMEGIGNSIKEIWQKIIAFIKKSIAWVKEYFAKIFNNNNAVKARLQKLMAFAKSGGKVSAEPNAQQMAKDKGFLGGNEVAHEDAAGINLNRKAVADVNVYKALAIGNNFPSNFAQALLMYQRTANTILRENDVPIKREMQILVENFQKGNFQNLEQTFHLPRFEIRPLRPTAVTNATGDFDFTLPEGLIKVSSDQMFGNAVMQAFVPSKDLTGPAAIKALTESKIWVAIAPRMTPKTGEMPMLSPAAADSIFKTVQEICDVISMAENMQHFSASMKEKLMAANNQIINEGAHDALDANDTEKHREINNILKINQGILKLMDQPALAFIGYATATNNALLSYVEKSLQLQHS